jgi:hypothetical protein
MHSLSVLVMPGERMASTSFSFLDCDFIFATGCNRWPIIFVLQEK